MIEARRYRIRGRVQAVGFRFFAIEMAQHEGVTGTVRNAPDGSVEVAVEGDEDAVARFEMALRRGPSGARVDEVETEVVAPTGRFATFRVVS